MLGIAGTYVIFGAFPALFFGLPAIRFLRRRAYSLLPATGVLTVGGGIVGALLMFVTFGMFKTFGVFEQFGAIAGASIGFVLGLLFFARSPPTATT
ncbi:MAG: hypothetical protein H0W65_02195 [Sphingomonas sp.]|uniref:hypothetical protein n=1 Tax=Sphingomonas sp. TaxID=28214 RepID=UPI0017CBF9A2|nr:hypothetical protein [Sphingomonas sp.]MBA3666519.1 hypothetical protein [Sphingomonas sp.]